MLNIIEILFIVFYCWLVIALFIPQILILREFENLQKQNKEYRNNNLID